MDNSSKHSGHRQRLKNKVKKFGIAALAEHEILELLLTYCIPRKDTNGLAHDLLDRFGTISNIIDANTNQLKLVNGVGEETAIFLKFLNQFIDLYLENKNTHKELLLTNTAQTIMYFRNNFQIKGNEFLLVLCLSKQGKLLNRFYVEGKDETEITISVEDISRYVMPDNVKQVIIIHTHPNGIISPSEHDINVTERINNICAIFGADLKDHYIINENSYFSFRMGGLIKQVDATQLKTKYNKNDYVIKAKSKK